MAAIVDSRIYAYSSIVMPKLVVDEHPVGIASEASVIGGRMEAHNIVQGKSDRKMLVFCIEDPKSLSEIRTIGERIHCAIASCNKTLGRKCPLVVIELKVGEVLNMCTASVDDGREVQAFNKSLMELRSLLCQLTSMGCHIAMSFQDTVLPQYFSDLICCASILPEDAESQLHRQVSSGLSYPVSFHARHGNADMASSTCIDSVVSSSHSHTFFSVTMDGNASLVTTRGNEDCFIGLPDALTADAITACIDKISAKVGSKCSSTFSKDGLIHKSPSITTYRTNIVSACMIEDIHSTISQIGDL